MDADTGLDILTQREATRDKKVLRVLDIYALLPRRTRRRLDKLVAHGENLAMAMVQMGIQPFLDLTKKDENEIREGNEPKIASSGSQEPSVEAKLPV